MKRNRKTVKYLRNSRLFIIALLILLQILLIFALSELMSGAKLLLKLFRFLLILWILSRQDNASYKISWILLIALFPLPGGLFYLIFGNKRMGLSMKKQLAQFAEAESNELSQQTADRFQLSSGQRRQAAFLEKICGAQLHSNTSAEYFPSGELLFQRLLQTLEQAEHFIFLEYFIISEGHLWDSVLDILKQKAQKGVEIRILADDVGCITTLPAAYEQKMAEYGIQFVLFNPLQPRMNTFLNYRDHRKIAIIDGHSAFTGGANLSDEYVNLLERHGHWKDAGIFLQGPGAENLTRLFLQLWQFSTGERLDLARYCSPITFEPDGFVQAFGGDPVNGCNAAKIACLQLCNHSENYLYITTPYLILDDESLCTLQTAARSGVDVRIITPHIPDKWYVHGVTRSFYAPLIEAGVRIFEYTPGFIHAKIMVSDDKQAIVGSINMDFRSFYLQFECAAALYNCSAIQDIKADFLAAERISQEITREQLAKTSLFLRIFRSFLWLIAPLL